MTGSLNSESLLWRPWESLSHNCKTCGSSFKRSGELKRHRESCHLLRIRKCSMCCEEFTRKDNLTRHMKNKHEVLAVKPRCKFCSKRLSRQDAAARHQKTCHKNPKRLSMSRCPAPNVQRPNVIVFRQTG